MAVKSQESLEEFEAELSLRVADRCDRCGAQAFFMFVGKTGDLLTCGHHGREWMDALLAQGFVVAVDNTHTINQKNNSSSEDSEV